MKCLLHDKSQRPLEELNIEELHKELSDARQHWGITWATSSLCQHTYYSKCASGHRSELMMLTWLSVPNKVVLPSWAVAMPWWLMESLAVRGNVSDAEDVAKGMRVSVPFVLFSKAQMRTMITFSQPNCQTEVDEWSEYLIFYNKMKKCIIWGQNSVLTEIVQVAHILFP